MNKKILLVGVLASGVFTAAVASAALAWSSNVTVSRVNVESDPTGASVGEVYLRFSANPHSTSCSGGNTDWVVGGNADTVKQIHASALAAKLSGTPVRVLFNNSYTSVQSCSGGGTSGYPVLRGLELQ